MLVRQFLGAILHQGRHQERAFAFIVGFVGKGNRRFS
jgi:hypothetical protein